MSEESLGYAAEEELENEEEDEKESGVTVNPFVQDMVPHCLSMLCKIGNGLSHAFVKMTCNDMELTSIDHMKNFIHVRYVDISGNMIRDITPMNHLTHLIVLKAGKNNITSSELDALPYLQILILSNNKIKEMIGIEHPQLTKLNLNFNLIENPTGLNSKILTNLTTLELRGNKLKNISGLMIPSLQNLYLAGNGLTSLEGLDKMKHLQILHLRDNQLEDLGGFSDKMDKLQYINLRSNNIKKLSDLQKLVCLPLLRALVLSENPCTEEDNYRTEVLIILRRLVRLDKDEYSDEDRTDAEELHNQRKQQDFKEKEEEEVEEED